MKGKACIVGNVFPWGDKMFGGLTDNFYNLVKGVVTLIQRSKVLVSVSMIDCYQRFITLTRANLEH